MEEHRVEYRQEYRQQYKQDGNDNRKDDWNEESREERKVARHRNLALVGGVCLLVLFLGWGHVRVSVGDGNVYRVILTRGVLFLVLAGGAFLFVLGSYVNKKVISLGRWYGTWSKDKAPSWGHKVLQGVIEPVIAFFQEVKGKRGQVGERIHTALPVLGDCKFRKYGKGMGFLVLLTVLILWIENEPTIYLDSYVQVEYEGYHKYGRSKVTVDWEGVEKAYRAQTSWLMEKLPLYVEPSGKPPRKVDVLEFLQSEVQVAANPAVDLENEEPIQLGINLEKKVLSQILKCKLQFRNPKRVVEGLEVVETFNPFREVELSFTGVNGKGVATVINKGEILESKGMYEFIIEKGTGLSNGDTVKVSLWMSDVDAVVKRYQMLPIITEAEYIVTGLDSYITDSTELDDATQQQLLEHAEYDVRQYVESIPQVVDVDFQYVGNYLMAPKMATPDTPLLQENIYGVVYEIIFHMYGDGKQYPTHVVNYYDVQFPNIVKLHNGGYDLEVEKRRLPTQDFEVFVEQKRGFWEFFKPKYQKQTFQGFESLFDLQVERELEYDWECEMEWNVLEFE